MAFDRNYKDSLVTGGAGFIGSHLSERLLAAGAEVACADNYFTGSRKNIAHLLSNPMFEAIRHDVTFPFYIEVDAIFNLACPASPIHYQRDPVQTTKTSVHDAINMLGLAKRLRAPIFQASTSEVYGAPLIHPQTEDYCGNVNPIGIRSCYDEGKRCAETLFFDYWRQHALPIKVARIFNTYGPRMQPQRWPRRFILYRPGAERRPDHSARRRRANSLVLLCRRSRRGDYPADADRRRLHRTDQSQQQFGIHHSGTGRESDQLYQFAIEAHFQTAAAG
jgi:nucleoside-diphosphate-sugar epimerase